MEEYGEKLFFKNLEEKYKSIGIEDQIGKFDHLIRKVIFKSNRPTIKFENGEVNIISTSNRTYLEKNYKDSYFIIYEWGETTIRGNIIHEDHISHFFPSEGTIIERNKKIDEIIND